MVWAPLAQHPSARLIVCSALLSLSCGGNGDNPTDPGGSNPPPPSIGDPAVLEIVGGNGQTGAVATLLPSALALTVRDADGDPVPGATLSWVGDGSVFAPATATGSEGQAQNQWTLGTVAGTQELEVRWVNPETGAPVVLGTFTATAVPGPADSLFLDHERFNSITSFVDTTVFFSPPDEPMLDLAVYEARAWDRYRNEIDNPTFSVSPNPDLQINGLVVSPEDEWEGFARVVSGAGRDSVRAHFFRDLTAYAPITGQTPDGFPYASTRVEMTCADGRWEYNNSGDRRSADSAQVVLDVLIDFERLESVELAEYAGTWRGTATVFWSDGEVSEGYRAYQFFRFFQRVEALERIPNDELAVRTLETVDSLRYEAPPTPPGDSWGWCGGQYIVPPDFDSTTGSVSGSWSARTSPMVWTLTRLP